MTTSSLLWGMGRFVVVLREMSMKKKFFMILIIITLGSVLIGIARFWFHSELDRAFTQDAVQVISYEINWLYFNDPPVTQEKITATIHNLIDASVINGNIKEDKPMDVYGSPFRVDIMTEDNLITVTTISAGPDKQFNTKDDIAFTDSGSSENHAAFERD